jgi:DHA2 family metal-tetracycline-proton antiporter-like MFS transporter
MLTARPTKQPITRSPAQNRKLYTMTEARSPSPETDDRGHPAVLVVVCTALFFGVVNGSAVAVVLPEIGADLNIAAADLSWVLSGFLLTYGVAIPFYGRLANRFGARRLFLIGVGVFALGSALSAIATGLGTLLAARTVQAAGGAAVPGLGMTLASRAFPEQRRGMVLGVASATMGLGAAAGPLGAGIISELADWRYLFGISALSVLIVPLGMRYLDRTETLNDEPLDLAGGALFGLGVAATLFFVTQGSQTGWTDALALTSATVAVIALVTFGVHQRHGATPFIPTSLLANRSYVVLTLLGFVITFANLAAQIGYPFLFNTLHNMSTLDIGIALIPAALTTAVVGVLAGRIVDKTGAAVPVRVGAVLMIAATIGLSSWVGTSPWTVAIIAMAFAAGFALVNTPLAAVVSLLVDPKDLASALSLNTMMFFIGGSFGATLFSSIVIKTGPDADALNPLHSGEGAQFSNAFAALLVPIAIGLALSAVLPSRRPAKEAADIENNWIPNCQVPWCPELEPELATATQGATSND